MDLNFETGWKKILEPEFNKTYFSELSNFVDGAYEESIVYPTSEKIFNAFRLCPYDTVKVVTLGQDPYHGEGQAHGLAFSVPEGIKIPPSLKNIYKELQSDLGVPISKSGNLEHWAKQGVLLLNSTLTVAAGAPGSHSKKGWEEFTNTIIATLSANKEHVVFMLWGNYAKQKGLHIDRSKHLVLEAAHPSPLGAYKGFFGCKHFSKTNEYLHTYGQTPIIW